MLNLANFIAFESVFNADPGEANPCGFPRSWIHIVAVFLIRIRDPVPF
jgi:hypothetical protein